MLRSTFLILFIHLESWSLNEGRHIYKIVKPVVLTGELFLVLVSSDVVIDPKFSW